MSQDYRRHHAVQVIFVETPAAGSPKSLREVKPGQYPRNPPTHWQPRTKPPSKAEQGALSDETLRVSGPC